MTCCFDMIGFLATAMSGEHFEVEDVGYVPENMEFPQIHSDEHDEGDVIDDSGFPQVHDDDDVDDNDDNDDDDDDDEQVGSLGDEDANPPEIENQFDDNDLENFPEINDALPQEHIEEQPNGEDVTENFGSPEKQGPGGDSKVSEIKKWPGWPGENVFRMLVPAPKVGSIIGRKGEFIKKITEETRARIKILDGPPGTAERAVSTLFNLFLLFIQLGLILDIDIHSHSPLLFDLPVSLLNMFTVLLSIP